MKTHRVEPVAMGATLGELRVLFVRYRLRSLLICSVSPVFPSPVSGLRFRFRHAEPVRELLALSAVRAAPRADRFNPTLSYSNFLYVMPQALDWIVHPFGVGH
jgi:hypothetical protein